MIGRYMDSRGHMPVEFDYDDLRPTLHLTVLQLLSLFAVLSLILLIYGLRSLRLKLSLLGRAGDKEALETKSSKQETEKHAGNSEKRNWWWIDAVVGTDEEERVQVVDDTDSSHYADGAKLTRWSSRQSQSYVQTTQLAHSIPMRPQTPPPVSMAKLIMSRHAHAPRRPRSPPKNSTQQTSQDSSHYASRNPSRLSAYVEA